MNPYIIGPYQESDAARFKGRSYEIEGMFRSFIQNDYLVCYADSGEGKSSILNAGLFPKLRDNRYFPISIRFNFYDYDVQNMDFDSVVNTAIDSALKDISAAILPSSLIFETDDDSIVEWQKEVIEKYVWLRLRYSELTIMGDNNAFVTATPVLVFDQFEEVFTNPESQLWTSKFFKWLEDLSRDVCPKHILDEIETVEEDISMMASVKRFKAIFSLRSEYVGDVDYWGLQHYYIPDLKNNRYFLKPLTPKGAEEVINQEGGLAELSQAECASLISGCAIHWEYLEEGLPCIPASILSVICHEIYRYNDRDRRQTLLALNIDRNQAVEAVLENYYINTLAKCGITGDRHRDAFENALVDDKGNRKRVGVRNKALSALSQRQIDCLIKENMLRIVSRSEVGDGDVVELPHDRFCLIIKNHKNKRFKEIQDRNRSLKEWIHFGALCTVLGILALLIHFDFIENLRPIIDDLLADNYTDIKESISNFIHHKSDASNHNQGLMALVSILLMMLILPLEFLGMAKQWKIFTLVCSILGICVSGWFVWIGDIWDISAGTSIFLSLLISLGTLIYTVVKWHKISQSDVSIWPLWGSWFLFFSYLYWEFVCCLIIGINEPVDSWEFIILLPLLFLLWTFGFFKTKIRSEGLMSGKLWFIAQVLLLLICLFCLAYNARLPYWIESKYPLGTIIMLLAIIIALVVSLLRNVQSYYKRLIAIVLNVIVILTAYVINLGYNPWKIEYRSVYRVASWRTVCIKDNATGLYGICNAVTGETIIPCVINSIKVDKLVFKSDKFKSNPISGGARTNSDGSFIWEWGSVEALFLYSPTLEEYISKVEKNSPDSLDLFAAKLYRDIRDLNIDYVVEAKPYLLSDVISIGILDSLQERILDQALSTLLYSNDTTITRLHPMNKPMCRPKWSVLTDADLYEFYAIATRSLFIQVLKDRISCEDYPSVITLLRMYPFIYFTSVPLMAIDLSFAANVTLNDYTLISDFKTNLCAEDVLSHKCFVWYELFINLCLCDIQANAQSYQERMQTLLNKSEMKELLSVLKEFTEDELPHNLENLKDASLEVLIEEYNRRLTWKSKFKDALRPFTDMDFTAEAYTEIRDLDMAFDELSRKLIAAMQLVLEKNTYGIYNSAFEDICKSLMTVRLIRGYDINDEFIKMQEIEQKSDSFYDGFTSLSSEVQKNYDEVSNLLKILFKELDLDSDN